MYHSTADPSPQSPARLRADALPAWITPELIEHTLRVWQPRYPTILTRDNAVGIILSVGHLFDMMERG